MELLSNSFQPLPSIQPEIYIQSEQDGLFFGLDYLQTCLRKEDFSKTQVYFSEGDCIFKGQTLLSIETESFKFKKEDLLSAVSYLSGAYTLISCWTEKSFDFSICATSSPHFDLFQWERKAILKAGAIARPFPKELLSLEQVQRELKRNSPSIILSELKINREKIKNLLKTTDPSILFDLHGSFLPSDLEEFREFKNINSVYPVYLKGFFPCLPMKLSE